MNWINVEENILLKRAIYRQDRNALEILHARHYQSILRYIAARVDSGADAEDLAQDVFVELCKGNGYYDGRGNTQEYLFGIARNTIRRYLRSRRNSIRTISIDSIADAGSGCDIQQHQDPVSQISERQFKKAIQYMIAKLPPKAQEAIKLRFINGLGSVEAAEKAMCSGNTFRQRLHVAIKTLRKLRDERQWVKRNI